MSSIGEPGNGAADTGVGHEAAHQKAVALGVLDCTLDRALWTHEAHLDFAAGIVRLYGAEASMTVSRVAIRNYNEVSNCANSDSGGYHETLTAYFCAAVAFLVDLLAPGQRLSDHSLLSREAPLAFWDRESLFSVAARRGWVPPLRPLPFALPFTLTRAGKPGEENAVSRRTNDSARVTETTRTGEVRC